MKILGIDPGRKPGYALVDTDHLVQRPMFKRALPLVCGAWLKCPVTIADAVATEAQWLHGPKKKDAVLKNAFIAGWQLRAACKRAAASKKWARVAQHVLPVKHWRAALGAGNVTKEVLCRRVERSLTVAELVIVANSGASPSRLLDIYDAIMIAWAAALAPCPWKEPP